MAERVIRGGVPIDTALKDFDAKTDEILAKRRALLASRERSHEHAAHGLDFRHAGAAGDRRVLRPAGAGRVAAEPHRLRPVCAGRHPQPALHRPDQLPRGAAGAAVLEVAAQHELLRRRRRAAVDRRVARRGAAAEFAAGARQGPVPHRAVRAGRDDRRRRRGDLEISVPHALRADQLRARAISASTRSTGSATRTTRCRRSSSSPCGRTSATT